MSNIIFIWFLGFFVSIFIGHYVTRYINQGLRCHIGVELENNKLTPTLGCIERAIYMLLFWSGYITLIAALFGIMIAQRLIAIAKLEKPEGQDLFRKTGERINVFFISNFISLLFGILGGLIIKYLK